MRAIAVDANEHGELGPLLDGMHQLRARVFAGWRRWQVRIEQGRERNEYDALGPTMPSQTFPQLLASGRLRAKPTRIQSSRFCVDSQREGRGGRFLHEATLTMFAGIIEWSMSNGFAHIAMATDVRFERIQQRAGWPMTRLGDVELIGETMSVADTLPADRASFERACPTNYRSDVACIQRDAA